MSTLKTQAEIIMERGRVKASTTVYSGPGYPIDPKAEQARTWQQIVEALQEPIPKPKHLTVGDIKKIIETWHALPNWYEFVDDDEKAFAE